MSYTGLATAIGFDIEVPHIIRLLGADMYRARARRERLDLDLSINLYLDAGTAVPVPNRYAKAWWRANRDPISEEVLGPHTIDECLKIHRQCQLAIKRKRQADDDAADPPGVIDPGPQLLCRPDVPSDLLSSENVTMLATMTATCPNCLPNRDAALKSFTKDQKHVRRLKAVRDSFQERRDAAARRAAGFLKLHEAAIMKEFEEVQQDDEQSLTSTKKRTTRRTKGKQSSDTTQQAAFVRERAEQELKALIAAGPNAKWAVGPTLDLNDIHAMLQVGPAALGADHSGYHMDHYTGRKSGVDSDTAAAPSSKGHVVDPTLSSNDRSIPDLDPDMIPHLMLLGTVAGPDQDPVPAYRKRTPPIPSHNIHPIDSNSSRGDSVASDCVHDADDESDGTESDLLVAHGQGDIGNKSERSSHDADNKSPGTESEDNDLLVEHGHGGAQYLFQEIDAASDHDSLSIASPGDIGGTAISEDDSVVGDAVLTENDSSSIEVATGPVPDTPGRPRDDDALPWYYSDDDDLLAGPADILGIVQGEDEDEDELAVDDQGLAARVEVALYLRNLVAQRTAGPSRQPPRTDPYTAADFEDVPDSLFA